MANSNICVSKKPLGIQHPYSYCVKPSNEMVPSNFTRGGLSMKNTGKVLGGLFNYVDYLTVNADAGTANICKDNFSKGVIGNKYVLQTNIKCRPVDGTGARISGEQYLHKYIDNTTTIGGLITGGRPMPDVNGLVPATFASAGKIGGNVMDIISSFSGDTNPYCMKVKMRCHVIDSKNPINNYKKFSPDVYLSLDDIEDIDVSNFESKPNIPNIPKEVEAPIEPTPPFGEGTGTTPPAPAPAPGAPAPAPGAPAPAPTKTTRAGFTNIIDNIIYQNSDKIQSSTEFESVINKINFQDEFLVKIYYVGFSILLIILIFKLLNKRKS